MKKLLIIVPSLTIGGQERVAVRTARILKNDYDVTMLIFYKTDIEYEHNDINVIDINIPATNNYFFKCINSFRRIYAIRKIKKEKNFDITFSLGTTTNIYNCFSKVQDRCVTSIRGYAALLSYKLIARKYYKKADINIGISKTISDIMCQLYKLPKEKVRTVYNPIDVDEIIEKSRESVDDYIFSDTFTIITVGRLDEIKGFEHLIRAFTIVKNIFTSAKLLIVGEGYCRNKLENLISDTNLVDNITLLGYRENPYKYIAKSSLYVTSSENEGFPNALAEAMCLVPAVSVDCKSGPREILSEGDYTQTAADVELADYGILTPPVTKSRNYEANNIEECEKILAEGIIKILSDKELYNKYKIKAFERAQQFSYEQYRKNIINIFEGI